MLFRAALLLIFCTTSVWAENPASNQKVFDESPRPVAGSAPLKPKDKPHNIIEQVCEDRCGDGECQAIVCLSVGCPCAETPENCPSDCGQDGPGSK